ncbi:hypothetical protein [Sinorhizobium americanum]|uniref:hypothetical protein n=1 Tax=Sinorhizobium americanum TaxID=194963 RepID=UPI0010448947|nr:hypothetical protein [Sinorhizobium americanum]
MGVLTEMLAFREAIESRMRALNLTGEVCINSCGSSTASWVGQPSDDDVIIEVRISRKTQEGNAE